jgi:hypothetical protein
VEEEVKPSESLGDLGEDGGNFDVFGDIAGQNQSVGAEGGGELLDIGFETLTLESEDQSGARLMPGLGDGPGDGSLVGHAKHQPDFSCE